MTNFERGDFVRFNYEACQLGVDEDGLFQVHKIHHVATPEQLLRSRDHDAESLLDSLWEQGYESPRETVGHHQLIYLRRGRRLKRNPVSGALLQLVRRGRKRKS